MVCWLQTGQFSMVNIFVISRFLSSSWYFIRDQQHLLSCLSRTPWICLICISKTSWWMNILWILVQCDSLTWNYVCRSVTYISWSSDFALFSDFKLFTYFCLYLFVEVWSWSVQRPAKTRISLGGCPGWYESSLGAAHSIWVFAVVAHVLCWRMFVQRVKIFPQNQTL